MSVRDQLKLNQKKFISHSLKKKQPFKVRVFRVLLHTFKVKCNTIRLFVGAIRSATKILFRIRWPGIAGLYANPCYHFTVVKYERI